MCVVPMIVAADADRGREAEVAQLVHHLYVSVPDFETRPIGPLPVMFVE